MKNNKLRKLLPPLISLIVAIACGIGMIYLYRLTKYLPIYLLGLTLLLPSAVNFSLFILKIPTKKKEKNIELTKEEPAPDAEEKKFKKILRAVGKAIKSFFCKICGKIDGEKVIRYLSIIIAAAAFVAIQYFFAISLKAAVVPGRRRSMTHSSELEYIRLCHSWAHSLTSTRSTSAEAMPSPEV